MLDDDPTLCLYCGEVVTQADRADGAELRPHIGADRALDHRWTHYECSARAVLGSLGHLARKCSCYGGTEEDPPEMSKREAARAALNYARLTREPMSIDDWAICLHCGEAITLADRALAAEKRPISPATDPPAYRWTHIECSERREAARAALARATREPENE